MVTRVDRVVTLVVGLAVDVVLCVPYTLTRPVFRLDLIFNSQITAANQPSKQMVGSKQEETRKEKVLIVNIFFI